MRSDLVFVSGGVTAPLGFTASAVFNGIKAGRSKADTALIFSGNSCAAAGVFTQNRVQAECVKLTKSLIADGQAQAVIVNSSNANACTGKAGYEAAALEAKETARRLRIREEDVLVCSTGVIGQRLPVEKIVAGLDNLVSSLSKEGHKQAREAIMTTDTRYKECAVQTVIAGKTVTIGAMAKGSGMIHINMGTMLAFVTTDCAVSAEMLNKALKDSVEGTFNCVSIDGDTSTNDTLLILANGQAGNPLIDSEGEDYNRFLDALNALNTQMAMKIAADGEGAGRLLTCVVNGARDTKTARALAKAVISSNLVKAAFFGRDANWGRVLCALGYSGQDFTPEKASVAFKSAPGAKRFFDEESFVQEQSEAQMREIAVFKDGVPLDFDEELAKQILSEEAVVIAVDLRDGTSSGKAWGCDLTYEYVKINGDYRT